MLVEALFGIQCPRAHSGHARAVILAEKCQSLLWLIQFRDDISEQLIVTWERLRLRERLGDPGDVHQMFPVNVLISGIATPTTTPEREGLAHAIP